LGLAHGVVVMLFACAPEAVAADKPNIVVFLVDDMGPMDTSVPFMTDENGESKKYPLNDYYRTPSMERLAWSSPVSPRMARPPSTAATSRWKKPSRP
jgi:hypothetical protein